MNKIESKVFTEVLAFINLLGDKYKRKLPTDLISFLERNIDPNYNVTLNRYTPIKQQNLNRNSIVMLSKINMQYWASIKDRENLKKIYMLNDLAGLE